MSSNTYQAYVIFVSDGQVRHKNAQIKRERPLKAHVERTERRIHAYIRPGDSGLGSLLVMDSCFGLFSSQKPGINDIALKMRFKPNLLK